MIELALALDLAGRCAPTVAPLTLVSVARAESGLDPLAIGVNGRTPHALHPPTKRDALKWAAALLAQGADLDLGIAQINARNLAPLRLTLGDAFDACRNLQASARLLSDGYSLDGTRGRSAQASLVRALSRYNTGDPTRGVTNGYVARIYRAAAQILPTLDAAPQTDPALAATAAPVRLRAVADAPSPARGDVQDSAPSIPPPLDIFAQDPSRLLVWTAPARPGLPQERPPSPLSGDPS